MSFPPAPLCECGHFIFVHFRIVPFCFHFASQSIISVSSTTSANVVFHIRAFPDVGVLFPIHVIVHHFRSLPSLIIGHYRIFPVFVLSPSGPFHIPSFPLISVFHIRPFPELFLVLFRHFPPKKCVLCSFITGRFRLEFPPFREPSVSVMLHHFRKILSFMSTISVIFQAFMLFFSSFLCPAISRDPSCVLSFPEDSVFHFHHFRDFSIFYVPSFPENSVSCSIITGKFRL